MKRTLQVIGLYGHPLNKEFRMDMFQSRFYTCFIALRAFVLSSIHMLANFSESFVFSLFLSLSEVYVYLFKLFLFILYEMLL